MNELVTQQYHKLSIQGFIVQTKGSHKFNIITDRLIYFYKFDPEDKTFMPQLESTMFNFMVCNKM